MRHSRVFSKTVIIILAVLATSPAFAQQWARKMFKQTDHDFGQVARGAKAEYAFELSNIFVEDVHISSVRSSCRCTSPRIAKQLLKTYEKGAIIASINTGSFLGHKSATLTVTIDKPYRAQVQLHVSVNIRGDVVFNPGSVQLGTLEQGEAAGRQVAVTYTGGSGWKIKNAKCANPHVTAEVTETGRRNGRVTYDLTVRLDKNAPAGYLKEHLMLATNDRGKVQIPLLIEGLVRSSVTVSPTALFMGVVKPGDKVTKQLVVRGKKPFCILSITCDDQSFEFGAIDNDTPKSVHLLPVTFVGGDSSGKVTKRIRIVTDLDETTPELLAYAVVTLP